MPQMAPISWLILFIIFTIVFMLFCVMNYYTFLSHPLKTKLLKLNTNSLNWKW